MKRVLITGTSRGLGQQLSSYLLKKGYFIYGTTRNSEILQEQFKNLKLIYLDLTEKASIERVGNYLAESNEPLDAVIHNSGVAYLDPADVLKEEECRHLFDVNFFGPLSLTKKLLPLMKTHQDATNLIFISSIVSIDHWPHLGLYAASKSAIETVAFEWAVLLKQWNIHVSVIQPNPLSTDMQMLRSENAKDSPYKALNNRTLQWEDTDNVCRLVHEILEDKSPKFHYQTGPYSKKTARNFLNLNEYQKALENYQKTILIK